MNSEDNQLMYSTADLAKLLKVGSPMVRKWALAYEGATEDKVRLKSKRDGRFFTPEQVSTITAAKQLVDIEGIKIDTALKMVIGQPQLAYTVSADDLMSSDIPKALEAILERNDATNQALLQEIRGLRQDLANMTVDLARTIPVEDSLGNSDVKSYTLLQVWVKRLFRL